MKNFKERTKKAMDMIMYQSINKKMAIAICATDAKEAIQMLNYINENL